MNPASTATLRALEDDIACAIRFDGRVMMSGEPGTGKKFVAHLIHKQSRRSAAAFVVASRQHFSESAPESSSTSEWAHPFKNGLWKASQDGTLLFDGIDKLTQAMQWQLSRLIENEMTNGGERRLMSSATTEVFKRVQSDDFHNDLFYRLNVIHVIIPPLRNHPEDIPILLQHYLSYYANAEAPRVSPAALRRLVEYAWPGNVQELKAVAEALSKQDVQRQVEPDDLPFHMQADTARLAT